MAVLDLPSSAAGFAQASWGDVLPYYERLGAWPLDLEGVEAWLEAWSRLEELLSEASALAMIAYTGDTADPRKRADHLRFSTEILPRVDEQGVRLARRLLDLGYSRPDLEPALERFRTQIQIFREENVPLFAELEELGARYQQVTGGLTVGWDGQVKTIPQLQPFLKSPDRSVRERAFREIAGAYLDRREELAGLFDRMFALRSRAAETAGFPDVQAFSFRAKSRFDYTPEDCARFHQGVEESVVPAVQRILEHRRQRLRLPALRPWDLDVDPSLRPPLRPFTESSELMLKSAAAFRTLDPVLGERFQLMIDEGLLDLESRPGKAPGGYCETLHFRGCPYIHMNAVGLVDDVMTLMHEAGHAFHAFAAHQQPLIWQRHPGAEAAELASMSMELLAFPHLAGGGLFARDEATLARVEHLEDILLSLVHIASVDAFQSWIYTSGWGGDASARDEAWVAIRSRFERGVDWSGLERERVARWYRQLHIFLYPFYYIEYGIAQLGALQIWANSMRNPAEAVRRYREALTLGSTRRLPDLYRAAGARLTFDPDDIGELVALVERELGALRPAA